MDANLRTGGHILIEQLALHNADTVFGVPGESFLAALDGMYQSQRVRFINARHEGGAAMMADAYGKLTGRPGIAFATRGPGATNASAGVHVAFQDSTPMILLLGQVGRDMMEREAFQEIDYRQMFGPMSKWVAQIDDARRIPEFISRAFFTATSGRPGPVVLALPEDMLTDTAEVPDAPPYTPLPIAPDDGTLRQFHALLSEAKKPFVIVGGGGWSDQARGDLEAFASAHEVPVGVSFRCQDYFDNLHPCYGGHIGIGLDAKIAERIRTSDMVIALGARLGEATTGGYTLFDIPKPRQPLVHVYPDPEEIGRVYSPTLGVVASSAAFAAAIKRLEPKHRSRADHVKAAHADYLGFAEPTRSPGDVQLSQIVRGLSDRLPRDTIICNGAGNYAVWVHRFWRYRQYRTELAPTSGSMGYGLPAAVAAKLQHPERTVICVCRRRLFPDDRNGVHDRGRKPAAADCDRLQQRHVRHDPDASGTEVSRPRLRHRSRQPRLRGACARLRRLRRPCRADRRLCPRFRRSRGKRTSGHHRAFDQPGSLDAGSFTQRNARQGVGRAGPGLTLNSASAGVA